MTQDFEVTIRGSADLSELEASLQRLLAMWHFMWGDVVVQPLRILYGPTSNQQVLEVRYSPPEPAPPAAEAIPAALDEIAALEGTEPLTVEKDAAAVAAKPAPPPAPTTKPKTVARRTARGKGKKA